MTTRLSQTRYGDGTAYTVTADDYNPADDEVTLRGVLSTTSTPERNFVVLNRAARDRLRAILANLDQGA